jgi:D-alanyl-lipoteichoic acid acyltransferase DltB (MBOAT superfamily)
MLFNSIKYLFFLPVVFGLFWISPAKWRVPILLLASYIFYMSWRPAFVFLILGLTIINFFFGKWIDQAKESRRALTTAVIAINLSTLAFFKYAYFLDDLLAAFLKPLGVAVSKLPFDIVLPLGISFFVFEFIHYVVDVYRGSKPIPSFINFALFASFFPTQIAGPIKRFQDFIPQFTASSKFSIKNFDDGVALILLGLFKKVLLADNLSFFVTGGFMHPELFSGLDLWLFTYAFAFQIYFDFSGYTDIARGSALLFGYKVPINFNLPYLATNISDFWHRWHISLSTWLRDYLFIPLGGSRSSALRVARNLLITMVLGGLWHGASLHFVGWGLFHGLLLVCHRSFRNWRENSGSSLAQASSRFVKSGFGKACAMLLTFQLVCIGWVFFRAESLTVAWKMLQKLCFLDVFSHGFSALQMQLPAINYPLIYPCIYFILPLVALSHLLMGWLREKRVLENSPLPLKAVWCLSLLLLVIVFSPDKSPRFIYFQF